MYVGQHRETMQRYRTKRSRACCQGALAHMRVSAGKGFGLKIGKNLQKALAAGLR